MPDIVLPMKLKIILDTAVTHCTVTRLSIYEEHGGMTFKIRLVALTTEDSP